MILNADGVEINKKTVTPKSLNDWLAQNDGYKNGKITNKWQHKLGLVRLKLKKPVKTETLRGLVCSGKSVILKVKEGYALAVGVDQDDKTFIVNDPSYTTRIKIDERDVLGSLVYN